MRARLVPSLPPSRLLDYVSRFICPESFLFRQSLSPNLDKGILSPIAP